MKPLKHKVMQANKEGATSSSKPVCPKVVNLVMASQKDRDQYGVPSYGYILP